MTTYELYFLILVCGAFTVLGLALAVATLAYRRSLRHDHGRPTRSAMPRSFGETASHS